MAVDLKHYACDCCGCEGLNGEMIENLLKLDAVLHGNMPRVARAFTCQRAARQWPGHASSGHTEGRSVDFYVTNQYQRHEVLLAVLQCFYLVGIQPRTVHVEIPTEPTAPYCIVA